MQNNYDWNPIKRKTKPKWSSSQLLLIGGGVALIALIITAFVVFGGSDNKKEENTQSNSQTEQQDNSTQNTQQDQTTNNSTPTTESNNTKKEETPTTTSTDAPAAATPAENQAAINTVLNSTYTGGASNANTCNLVPKSYSYNITSLDSGSAAVTVITQNTNGASKTINLTMKKSAANWAITAATCS